MRFVISVLILASLLFLSCKTKTIYVPVETQEKQKEYVDRWQRDSIYLHDSIFVEKKGDTIWLQKYKTIYKERLVRDSIFVTDSIQLQVPYPVVEVREVNRLRTWQIILMCLGGVLIGYVGFRLMRW